MEYMNKESFRFNWDPWPEWFGIEVGRSIQILPEIIPGVGFNPENTYCLIKTDNGVLRANFNDEVVWFDGTITIFKKVE